MPELPEVESLARALRQGGADGAPPLVGRRIVGVRLNWPGHVDRPSPRTFRARLRGRTVRAVGRRAKYLVVELDRGTLLLHLRMSGDLRLAPTGSPPDRFTRSILRLDDGWELRFSDARKFGRLFLVDDPAEVVGGLGPEPLERSFTAPMLARRLRTTRRVLKPLLLDQRVVAGVGNIYADEALHRAGLHPARRSDSLSPEEAGALWRGLRAALRQGLRHNGASIDWVYRGGDYQNHFRVYQRAGEPCPVCGTPIVRIVLAQRGTHFCPTCQPESPQ